MKRLRLLVLGLLLLTIVDPRAASANGLRKVERATSGGHHSGGGGSHSSSSGRSGSSFSGAGYTSSSYTSSAEDEGCGPFGHGTCDLGKSLAIWGLAYTLGLPWVLPRRFDDPTLMRYAAYPFADAPGLLRLRRDDKADTTQAVAVALDMESGYMVQGVVPAGLAVRALLPRRFELDGRFSGLFDVREHPVEIASAGSAHLTYRFAQGRRFDFRSGLGLRMFQLDSLQLGFDILYGVDSYLGRRAVWRIELHLGSAGQALVGQARSTIGVMLDRFELYAGYDHTAYMATDSPAALGGPIAGLRAWF